MTKTTLDLLIELEPRISQLIADARGRYQKRRPRERALWIFYTEFKPQVRQLVGYSRRGIPLLGTSLAYDIVYDVVYHALIKDENPRLMVTS
jgi:hypothetical protein